MRKRFFASLLSLCMVVSLLPGTAFATGSGGDTTPTTNTGNVAKIGDTEYATLAEAVEAAQGGETITLLKDCSGGGIGTFQNGADKIQVKDFTIDFAGHTYTCTGPATGSAGTQSQAFHLEWNGDKDNNIKVTLKNGKITSTANSGVYMLVQNYCDLTLDKMTLDGTNIGNGQYTLSNNSGSVTIKDTTIIAPTNGFAFDSCDFQGYKGVSVTVEGNSDIQGKVELSNPNGGNNNAAITINGGTFSDESVKAYLPAGKTLVEKDGKYVVEALSVDNAVAKIGETPYKTLKEAVAAAKDGDTVTLLKNSTQTEQVTISEDLNLNLGGFTLESTASYAIVVAPETSFTIKNGTLDAKGTGGAAIAGLKSSTITVDDDAIVKSALDGIMATNNSAQEGSATINVYGTLIVDRIGILGQGPKNIYNIDGATINSNYFGVYQNGSYGECTININDSTIVDTLGGGVYVSNSSSTTGQQTLNITNSSITGPTAVEVKYTDVTIENSTLKATAEPPETTLNNNGMSSTGYAFAATHNGKDSADHAKGTIKIVSGNFEGLIGHQRPTGGMEDNALVMTIEKGLFSSDPSEYCVKDKTGVANDDSATNKEYPWTVGEAKATAAQVAAGAPNVVSPEGASDTVKNIAATLAGVTGDGSTEAPKATIQGAGVEAAAKDLANANTEVVTDDHKAALNNADDIKIVVAHYMDIAITDATEGADGKVTALTVDITPKAQKYATTANLANNEEINDKKGTDGYNAVPIGEPQPLKVTGEVTISLPLPAGLMTGEVHVKHVKSSSKSYIYTGKVENNILAFTNPNGFSEFIIGVAAPVAKIGDVGYESLQDAVDDVQNGQTITVNKTGEAKVANKTISFKVTCEENVTATIKDYQGNPLTPDANGVYKVTRKSSGSGSGTTTYAITTNSPANGTVTASPKSAAKGATVTLTVTPTEGYQLDKLTVADKDGKEITLTDKGNGKYTFTMPASKVEVTATFKQAPVTHVCPAEKYTDVDTTQWYHEGVDYVIANGMMNGTGTNIFEPNATTTRGMIVTILYRLEKEPAAGTSPFTDVDAGQWYAKAVAWAAANGVVNGTSPTTFNPNDPITREQMAAILYRYASFKGYDVTGKADLAGYTDASQISAYAKEAMSWANKAGLIGGVSATTLQPQGSATRAQVATILMRFCENVAK